MVVYLADSYKTHLNVRANRCVRVPKRPKGLNDIMALSAHSCTKLPMSRQGQDTLRIGIVDVQARTGGVRTFIDKFAQALNKSGYIVRVLDISKTSLSTLNSFDILHFSNYFLGVHTWKLLFVKRPKKIITIHGWIKKEVWYAIKHDGLGLRAIIGGLLNLSLWKIFPLLFDAVSCPNEATAEESGLKNAKIIPNCIFPEDYQNILPIDVRLRPNELVFTTYISLSGLEERVIDKIIRVVNKVNQMLTQQSVVLLIFGRAPTGIDSASAKFMGFSRDFPSYLKGSDLLVLSYTTPGGLGYVTFEAGVLGIPVAKFTRRKDLEELVENQTGILAQTEEEMIKNLLEYALNVKYLKPKLGKALHEYIEKENSWNNITSIWSDLFYELTSEQK